MHAADSRVHVAFASLPDLAGELVGGVVCSCTDEFFGAAANLLRREPARFDPDAYDEHGKVMDGWESRRARRHGRPSDRSADAAIIRLGIPGEVVGVDVDTSHFLGNAPRSVQLHAAELAAGTEPSDGSVSWTALAPRTTVVPGSRNLVPVDPAARGRRFTHVRLAIHPDGGVARLRVHGTGIPARGSLTGTVDLAAVANGGCAVAASDEFFGGISQLILPGESRRMDEGWETRRTRDQRPDEWVVVRLAAPGRVRRVTVDTSHFRGNAPDAVRLEGALLGARASTLDPGADPIDWRVLVPTRDVAPDSVHELDALDDAGVVDHVRLVIEPDGGVARLRVWGEVADR